MGGKYMYFSHLCQKYSQLHKKCAKVTVLSIGLIMRIQIFIYVCYLILQCLIMHTSYFMLKNNVLPDSTLKDVLTYHSVHVNIYILVLCIPE